MKILHIVAGGLHSGAARGAYWLHKGLETLGVNSKMLINSKDTLFDSSVESINTGGFSKIRNDLRIQLDLLPVRFYRKRLTNVFSTSTWGYNFTKHPLYNWADVVHLHWVNDGFVNVKHLKKIKKPIVWTIRDMWPFTGGCHYSMNCTNYKTGCGSCEQLASNRAYDLSKFVLNRKQKYYSENIKVVGISNWICDKARESKLFNSFDIRMISNNINTADFFPVEKILARRILGIDTNKKIILVGAHNVKTYYKGFDKYLKAIELLDKDNYFLVFFGNLNSEIIEEIGFEYKKFDFLNDTVSLRLVYSSADVFVAPSLMESFGKTLVEAMACGTPVVCFDATGPKDIVDHQINGYRAKPFESSDLMQGISWVLNHPSSEELEKSARQKAENTFDSKLIAEKYVELYNEIIKQ